LLVGKIKGLKEIMRKATVLVPNLFTVGNMALGFFAITAAVDSRWIAAPTAIFIAHLMDIVDGRVARWMKIASRFGGEFDSFADWLSFGIAPAIMIYLLALKDYGKLGFLLSFFFVLCGAIRLTRFNLKSSEGTENAPGVTFTGLPIPGAGGFLAILVLLFGLVENGQQGRTMNILYRQIPFLRQSIPIIVFGLSLLMVSKIQYSTFKRTQIFRPQSLQAFMMLLFVCFMVYSNPENTIFILYFSYILWGILSTGWRAYRIRIRPTQNQSPS
jgi:CDP-diacylglycerol--serine O-phosphatidyltransferase